MQVADKDPYKNVVRIRACGILKRNEQVLLIELHSPVSDSLIWTAPGGGVMTGETIKTTVEREFAEETGLLVRSGNILLIHELVELPYHALEFFLEVEYLGGTLKTGLDPEREQTDQIIKSVRYVPVNEIEHLDIKPALLKNVLLNGGTGEPPVMALKQE